VPVPRPGPAGEEPEGLDPREFRRVLGHFVTGVAVAAAFDPALERPCGLTVNAVASVSLRPPLVLVCVDRASDSHDGFLRAGSFSLNVLAAEQVQVARRFSALDVAEKFRGVGYRKESTGAPVLEGVLAWLDCRTWATYPGGDHTIFVGEVVAADAREGVPLVYYQGGYGRFVP